MFGVGKKTVTCDAVDVHGNNEMTKTFSVDVVETTVPVVSVPAAIVGVEATGSSGASVAYSVSASDIVDGVVVAVCTVPGPTVVTSPHVFGIGTGRVTCGAGVVHGENASTMK